MQKNHVTSLVGKTNRKKNPKVSVNGYFLDDELVGEADIKTHILGNKGKIGCLDGRRIVASC